VAVKCGLHVFIPLQIASGIPRPEAFIEQVAFGRQIMTKMGARAGLEPTHKGF
jgi:hypothetical protein